MKPFIIIIFITILFYISCAENYKPEMFWQKKDSYENVLKYILIKNITSVNSSEVPSAIKNDIMNADIESVEYFPKDSIVYFFMKGKATSTGIFYSFSSELPDIGNFPNAGYYVTHLVGNWYYFKREFD